MPESDKKVEKRVATWVIRTKDVRYRFRHQWVSLASLFPVLHVNDVMAS